MGTDTTQTGDTTDNTDTTDTTDTTDCENTCSPEDPQSCVDDGTFSECVLTEEGCYDLHEIDCAEDSLCIDDLGCIEILPNCQAIHEQYPQAPDGVYMIDSDGIGGLPEFEVVCDMTTDGGGWTLVANNDQTMVFNFFNRDWQDYREGFGALVAGERGWIGNERLHVLTGPPTELQVRHQAGSHLYADFSVGAEDTEYQLNVAGTTTSNDGGYFVSGHDGMMFTTYDRDNDQYLDENCALIMEAGWWYNGCFNMAIASHSDGDQAYWRNADGEALLLVWVQMWIR